MSNATEVIQNYRLASRDLWNKYFYGGDLEFRDSSLTGDFDYVKPHLFESLVSRRLEYERASPSAIFGSDFQVVPRLKKIYTLRVDVGLENAPGECWAPVPGSFRAEEIELYCLDSSTGCRIWRDFRYLLVHIERCPRYPEHEGRHGIVEFEEVDIIWTGQPDRQEVLYTVPCSCGGVDGRWVAIGGLHGAREATRDSLGRLWIASSCRSGSRQIGGILKTYGDR